MEVEAASKSALLVHAPLESIKMETWIWMQAQVLVVEGSLEEATSNRLCHLVPKVPEEEERQVRRGVEIPEQPNMLSSEACEGSKPTSWNPALQQVEQLSRLTD